ncbi:MAG: helicase-exonuclease AddAB subunit AddB [Clostridiales bacterium]|nr:helicase-exonuclease AddAB subunit AddB [Clostridiales bacterium]
MPLQLILGSSGSGKSYRLYNEIIEKSIKNKDINYIAIVPEQFTMQTQKDIVSMHPNKGVMNIDIVSFERLAYKVFDEVGINQVPILDDTGKSLVLRKVVEDKKKELEIYRNKIKLPGFIGEVKSMVSELYQYGIHEEEMEKMLSVALKRPMLQAKLKDISLIQKGFKEYIDKKYITAEEILEVLCRVLDESIIIKNSIIFLDGFTGFTPIQYKLLGLLMQYSKMVIVTVTIDGEEDPYTSAGEQELFHLSKTTIQQLTMIAKEYGSQKSKDIIIGDKVPLRFKDARALAVLEKNLFRYPNGFYDKDQDAIEIHVTRNPKEEAEYTARKILKLVREKGYRFKDIAVVTGDMERYIDVLKQSFGENNIPYFMDHKTSIMGNPFIEFIRGALNVIDEDFSYESVFRYLRSGMTKIEREEIDYLENYCIALGIRGNKRWQTKWVRSHIRGEALDLEHINGLREIVIEALLPLRENLKDKKLTVKEHMTELHSFIRGYDIQGQLASYEEYFLAMGKLDLVKEYKQTYRLVMELFDKVVSLLGDEVIPSKELALILDAGFEDIKVGIIPPSVDQVLIGDTTRTRLKDVKSLFFIGVNDGIIPKSSGGKGLLSQLERNHLSDNKIVLAPTMKQNAYIQKFYLYLNMTKPSNHLFVSYSKMTGEGSVLRPSYLISTIKKIFPKIEIIDEENKKENKDSLENSDSLSYMTTPKNVLSYWVHGLSSYGEKAMTSEWKELFSWYLNQEEWKEKLDKLIEAAFYNNKESGIGKLAASALYGPNPLNSVTRLEKYAACGFAHYIAYGLGLEERQEYAIASMDLGNIFHSSIERFSKKLKAQGLDWRELQEKDRKILVKESVSEVTTDYGNMVLQSSARNAYFINRLERITDRTVWALSEQIKKGSFNPTNYEIAFSEMDGLDALTIPLCDGQSMKLKGRIDRMDLYEDEDHVYVKVIDYKSGGTTFELSSVYYGLQLQLIVYMEAALETARKENPEKIVIPAGIFYYNIKDPVVNKEDVVSEDDLNSQILSSLKMNGLVNSDKEVIALIDGTIDKKSDVIPVSYNTKGELTKNSSAVSKEKMDLLTSYVQNKIKNMGEEILEGSTLINPYEKGNYTACDYCPYKVVCRFDEKGPGYRFRRLKNLDADKVWEKIRGEED